MILQRLFEISLTDESAAQTGRTAAATSLWRHSSGVQGVAFSADGRHIGTASHDMMVRVWSAATGALLKTLKGHSDNVSRCVFARETVMRVH